MVRVAIRAVLVRPGRNTKVAILCVAITSLVVVVVVVILVVALEQEILALEELPEEVVLDISIHLMAAR